MQDRTLNISRIVETIEEQLRELDAHLEETSDRKLDARTTGLLRVQFILKQTVAALSSECPPLSDDGDKGYIPTLRG